MERKAALNNGRRAGLEQHILITIPRCNVFEAYRDQVQKLVEIQLDEAKAQFLTVQVVIVVGGFVNKPGIDTVLENICSELKNGRNRFMPVVGFHNPLPRADALYMGTTRSRTWVTTSQRFRDVFRYTGTFAHSKDPEMQHSYDDILIAIPVASLV